MQLLPRALASALLVCAASAVGDAPVKDGEAYANSIAATSPAPVGASASEVRRAPRAAFGFSHPVPGGRFVGDLVERTRARRRHVGADHVVSAALLRYVASSHLTPPTHTPPPGHGVCSSAIGCDEFDVFCGQGTRPSFGCECYDG